ncbi:hypothetical protein DACRYDRAFT_105083 [Dacryopinax primogenitus]|uniref:Phytanoyl-CoA dioxygenase n=1 Tax=Dacryopinax primogenitus (strain DJM 731) TaxID=1858805 RepID=M5GCR2_DACPD|nr:uncharacterized protein DACRYDRAFT_105083 [Dacryopinax primogenitus]EJU04012.1 hypothetical protein DACRYDRAFT_105083 [Dacryopinax primogenitus]
MPQVVLPDQSNYKGAKPVGAERPSPQLATGKEDEPQWLKDFQRDGYVVNKDVVSREKALNYYAPAGEDWLEGFKLGYKRDDPSTWDVKNLPRHIFGGLYGQYSFSHAQFVWDAKTEPNIVELFEKLWGTKELTVSFDGGSLAVPLPLDQVEGHAAPWPHSDQSAYRPQRHCVQGLLNILPNGPEDGGLMVLKGSALLFERYFQEHKHLESPDKWLIRDGYFWDEAELKWFYDRGCEWVKPAMDPGDFVLWDSRQVHYGAFPKKQNKRFAIYICYKPMAFMTEEQKERKIEAFNRGYCTTHDPCDFLVKSNQEAEWNVNFPYAKPVINEQGQKAIGLIPY